MDGNLNRSAAALVELEQIERALRAIKDCEATLGTRRELLMGHLEEVTRPAPVVPPPPAILRKGYRLLGLHEPCTFDIDIYAGVIGELWRRFPERREAMASAAARCGNYRPYIARSRAALFLNYPAYRAYRFSRELGDGWYLDTNMNSTRMERILPPVVRAAGLTWGQDVEIFWRDAPRPA